jgi:hypothetical protein
MTSYACPRCHRIGTQLLEVRYAIGLEDRAAELMCATCVDELQSEELAYSRGRGSARAVWAIEILRIVGAAIASEESEGDPVKPARLPRTAAASTRPRRAARGGVGV